jgi:hypothetical protein
MTEEEMKEEMMLAAACAMYGSCMESAACESMIVAFLMKEYGLSERKAEMTARLARAEWAEAYS